MQELIKVFNFHRFDNLITQNIQKIDPRKFRDEKIRQSTLCLLYSATTGDVTALKRSAAATLPLFKSVVHCEGNAVLCFRFYSTAVDMKACNYDRRTALHLASAEGHFDCVKFLVETCGLNPLVKDRWGFTPLVEAKRFQHDLVFRY